MTVQEEGGSDGLRPRIQLEEQGDTSEHTFLHLFISFVHTVLMLIHANTRPLGDLIWIWI